jgi:hypothetical protein
MEPVELFNVAPDGVIGLHQADLEVTMAFGFRYPDRVVARDRAQHAH